MSNICDLFKEYKACNNYVVKDITNDSSEYIFILESPHNTEINEKCPAVGESGKSMAKFIGINKEKPLGKVAKDDKSKISIMNVSEVPLDLGNIKKEHLKYNDLVEPLLLIKVGHESFNKHRDININQIETLILEDFKMRINKFILKNSQVKIVVCGKLAQSYFEKATNKTREEDYILYVPHLSRNNWYKEDNDLDKLKDKFSSTPIKI